MRWLVVYVFSRGMHNRLCGTAVICVSHSRLYSATPATMGVRWGDVQLHVAWPVLQQAPPMFLACPAGVLLCSCQCVCVQAARQRFTEPWCSGSYLQHRAVGWVGLGSNSMLFLGQCCWASASLPLPQLRLSLRSLLLPLPACLSISWLVCP